MCHAVQDHSHFTLPGLYRVISVSLQQHHMFLLPSLMQHIIPEDSSRYLNLCTASFAALPSHHLQKHAKEHT